MVISWQPLSFGGLGHGCIPPLLISPAFTATSYTIHLTDLTNIWVESLGHAAILKRAEDQSTSIDPTDSSQLQILLEKLGSALLSDPKTHINLHTGRNSGRVRPDIVLNLTIELPGGLAPLQWPLHLTVAPQMVLTNQLTMPLMHAQHARIREIDSLKEALEAKDHVVQKLLDKFEAQGIDLGQVFPQATTKNGRKVDRVRAKEKVRGLRKFDIQAWEKELAGDRSIETVQLLREVFAKEILLEQEARKTTDQDDWWLNVNDSDADQAKPLQRPTLNTNESTQDNDAFQVQSSLPHPFSEVSNSSPKIAPDDSTDEEDLNAPSQSSRVPDSYPTQALATNSRPKESLPSKTKGDLGGRGVKSKESRPLGDDTTDEEESLRTETSSDVNGKKHDIPTNDESTEDEDLPEYVLSTKEKESSIVHEATRGDSEDSPPRIVRKSGIRRIGGKNIKDAPKLPPPPPTREDTATEDEDEDDSVPTHMTISKPSKGRFGNIGIKKDAPPPPSFSSSPSPSPSPPPSPPVKAPKPKKGKIGQVGGKRKATPSNSQTLSEQEIKASQTPVKRKIGAIGNRNSTPDRSDTLEPEVEAKESTLTFQKEKTPPQETEEERAEKRRRELRKQLDEKAMMPVKKKRRF